MDLLPGILSSRVRAEIFRLLFGLQEQELHVREIARRANLSEAAVRQELKQLELVDLAVSRKSGNRRYYRANPGHPLYIDIHRLVLKTSGLVEVIGAALVDANVELAFVFGSLAEGRPAAESDVDLMVIGSFGLRKLSSLLSGVGLTIGREVNPHVLSRAEYRRRFEDGDHFVTNVLGGPKLFVMGTEDDLAAMGG
ncbi:MAG: ArsR family transcriptional regulator [Acidobacteria bacterium]|nr:MAG: ArsR family transcriptional regulator [Acidobacteriota bacterium]